MCSSSNLCVLIISNVLKKKRSVNTKAENMTGLIDVYFTIINV